MKQQKRFVQLVGELARLRDQIIMKKKEVIKLQREISTTPRGETAPSKTIYALEIAIFAKITASSNFRHHHVDHCELMGRTRDQIENNIWKTTPKLDERVIDKIKLAFGPSYQKD